MSHYDSRPRARSHQTTFILVRHGETSWNVEHRLQGHTDIELNERGRRQAEAAAEGLRYEPFDRIISSDLKRASLTAETIAAAIADAPPVELEPALREHNLGIFQSCTPQEAMKLNAAAWHAMRSDAHYVIPDGESLFAFSHRIVEKLTELAISNIGKRLLIVAHGGVASVILRHILGMPFDSGRNFAITNAAINEFTYSSEKGWFLWRWNETAHLRDTGCIDL